MNNIKKISLEIIKNFLKNNSIELDTALDLKTIFNSISSIKNSNSEDLTFFHNSKYLNQLKETEAKACLIQKQYISYLNKKCIPIIVDDPYLSYALISNLFYPSIASNGIINRTAQISKEAIIGDNVQINANVVINRKCVIKNDVVIYENSTIGPDAIIGKGTRIMSNCFIANAKLGDNCFIKPGAVIGGKGFGFAPKQKIEIKHIGDVKLGNNVEIGSNTTIDQGTIHSTIIDDNCRIDNLVQIAHNVEIGKNTIIAAQTGIAGSTKIGKNCIMAGQVAVSGHLNIGNNVTIAGKSGVTKNIENNSTVAGFPALEINKWKKTIIRQYKGIK